MLLGVGVDRNTVDESEGNDVTDGMLVGVQTPTQRPWPELAEQWAWLERIGFDSLWLADHYVPPFKLDGPIFEPWTLLEDWLCAPSVCASGCSSPAHLPSPSLVAKEAVTIDHISGGRLEFGLGAGWFVPEHEMFGIPFPDNAELVGRFREAVEMFHQSSSRKTSRPTRGRTTRFVARRSGPRRCSSRGCRLLSARTGRA